jgi:hypothetical protein
MWDPAKELGRFYLNDLTAAEQAHILWHSAEAYLGRDLSQQT